MREIEFLPFYLNLRVCIMRIEANDIKTPIESNLISSTLILPHIVHIMFRL